jgi:hypothetical protein
MGRVKIVAARNKTMKFGKILFTIVLFYALIPGVLVRLPPGGSTMTVNLTHAVVFGLLCYLTKSFFKSK